MGPSTLARSPAAPDLDGSRRLTGDRERGRRHLAAEGVARTVLAQTGLDGRERLLRVAAVAEHGAECSSSEAVERRAGRDLAREGGELDGALGLTEVPQVECCELERSSSP